MECRYDFIIFYGKKELFNKYDILNNYSQRINWLLIFITLYGIKKLNLTYPDKALIKKYIKKCKVYYIKNFIDKNCKKKNEEAKDLIKKLLELKNQKKIKIKNALNHNFFKQKKYVNDPFNK